MNNKADTKNMEVKQGTYYTVAEMANMLGIPVETLKTRLKNKGIKPLSRDALYSSSDFEIIKDAPMGRPKKAPEKPPAKKTPVAKKKPASKKTRNKKT